MLSIETNQSMNRVTLVGRLMEVTLVDGKTKGDGRDFKRGNLVLRVSQTFGKDPKTEVSEIPVSFIAMRLKKDGSPNPAYDGLANLANYRTAQAVGVENADRLKISGANVQENTYVPRGATNEVLAWQLRSSFFGVASPKEDDCATFSVDVVVMAMRPETTRDGDETGRVVLEGAVVQYGGKVEIVRFIVENPDVISYIERHWEPGSTVNVKGRVRVSTEVQQVVSNDNFGEEVPEQTTRTKRELVITSGSNEPKDEEASYDTAEIKKGLQERKARIAQMMEDAKKANAAPRTAAAPASAGKVNKAVPAWDD